MSEELVRVHILLYKSDKDYIMENFGGADDLGFSKVIRQVVRKWVLHNDSGARREGE